MVGAKKLLRSLLVFAPGLQDTRFRAQARFIRTFRRPYQPEFEGLRALRLADPLVLDVGCNRGISIETILAMRPDARVIGFEANPFLAADTKEWFAAEPRVDIRPVGLGNQPGRVDIFVPRYRNYRFDGLGSLDRSLAVKVLVNDYVYWFDPRHLRLETMSSEIARLDDLKLSPAVIKLYVQGHEEQVLDGATETIRSHEPVILAPSGRAEIDTRLRSKGYQRFQWLNGSFVPESDSGYCVYYITASRYQELAPGLGADRC